MILGMDGFMGMVGIVATLAGVYYFFQWHDGDDDHHNGAGAVGVLACAAI